MLRNAVLKLKRFSLVVSYFVFLKNGFLFVRLLSFNCFLLVCLLVSECRGVVPCFRHPLHPKVSISMSLLLQIFLKAVSIFYLFFKK